MKVQILVPCEHCYGQAYLPIGQVESYTGEKYTRYQPCPDCNGGGSQTRWLSLEELASLLQQMQCPHQRTYTRGGFHYNGEDVWDDIQEVCTDCGVVID